MKIKGNDIIIGLVLGFVLWLIYLIFVLKFDPNKALASTWQNIQNFFNNIVKKIQELIKKAQTPSVGISNPKTGTTNGGSSGGTTLYGNISKDVTV